MADKAKKTETVKKAETTAKPRKAPVKKKKAELTPVATMVSREEIERLAHKYWAAARPTSMEIRSWTGSAPSRSCGRRLP